MSYRFGVSRDEVLLLPESVDDYVGAENPVRAIDAFIEGLELTGLGFELRKEGNAGAPGYDPRAMLKLYLYGYINRIRSSRDLERATRRNLEVIWLLRRLMPDHWTINDFRRQHRDRFKAIFRQFNLVCGSLGLFGADLVAIDGTLLKAVNNPRRNFTRGQVAKMLAEIDERTEAYLKELETADGKAEAQSIAGEVREDKAGRLRRKLAEMDDKRRNCQALLAEMEQSPTKQISLTDPDSRFLDKGSERTVGYNAQIAVDAVSHLIVGEEITQEANDSQLLAPMAVAVKTALGVERLQVIADTGYYDHGQIRQCVEAGIEPYVPQAKVAPAGEGLYGTEAFKYDVERDLYVCPQGRELTRHSDTTKGGGIYHTYYAGTAACRDCPVRPQCTRGKYRKLNFHEDQPLIDAHRERQRQKPGMQKQRASIVEHVFGTLKFWQGYRSFLTRRLPMVRAEFSLSCLAYNFRRVLNLVGPQRLLRALQTAAARALTRVPYRPSGHIRPRAAKNLSSWNLFSSSAAFKPSPFPACAWSQRALQTVFTQSPSSPGSSRANRVQSRSDVRRPSFCRYTTSTFRPPNAGAVSPKPGGVSANTGGVPASTGGVPASTGGVPANAGGVPANAGGVPANAGGVSASTGGVSANAGGVQTSADAVETSDDFDFASTGGVATDTGGVFGSAGAVSASTGGCFRTAGVVSGNAGGYSCGAGGCFSSAGGISTSAGECFSDPGGFPATRGADQYSVSAALSHLDGS